MAFQNNKQRGTVASKTAQAPRPSSVTIPAHGDSRPTGAPGPTPAPAKRYKNPLLVERQETPGYGNAKDLGPSSISIDPNDPHGYGQRDSGPVSVDPSLSRTSPLADELKRLNAEGDGGDALQDVIDHGTARNNSVDLVSSQTRPFTLDQRVGTAAGMKRQTAQSSKPGDVSVGTLPATLGANAAPDPKEPN
jgi:hypothetical protein